MLETVSLTRTIALLLCCCCCCVASVVSDSVQPHRWQPARLPCPWDSPGKNTGVGFHFPLQCVKVKSLSRFRLLATPWTVAYQAPPSMGFSKQEYWSGVPLPSPIHNNLPQRTQTLCFCSVAQSCLTLCDPMDCSMPGFPVLHHLLELTQTHVH